MIIALYTPTYYRCFALKYIKIIIRIIGLLVRLNGVSYSRWITLYIVVNAVRNSSLLVSL